MIITCEQCQTRFKVDDQKLSAGPVRMRCSKCNHVFMAAADGSVRPVDPAATQPPTVPPQTMPPTTVPPSTVPPSTAPLFGAPRAATRDPFAPRTPTKPAIVDGRPAGAGLNDPFAPRVPSKPDPFAGLGTPSTPMQRQPTPSDPFAALGKPKPPADLFGAPRLTPDPFGTPRMATPQPVDPFAVSKMTTPQPNDPFATLGKPPDSFTAQPTVAAGMSPNPFGASPSSDPFGVASSAPASSAPDIDAAADPFAAIDPFADSAPGPAQPPPPPPEDPFADIGDPSPNDAFASPSFDAREALFGITAPPAPSTPPIPSPSSTGSGLELASETSKPVPVAPPSAPRASRAGPVLRAAAVVVQVVVVLGAAVIAAVFGSGGDVRALAAGDMTGAFRHLGDSDLVIDDVRIARRDNGKGTLLVITGVVHHRGETPYPVVVVEADLGDGNKAKGHAWSPVDAVALENATTDEDLAVLQAARAKEPKVSPGERAPFVIVARAPTTPLRRVPIVAVPEK